MDLWPCEFALDVGETADVFVGDREHTVTLHSVEYTWEPDYWIATNAAHRTLQSAELQLTVDGENATLWLRPYQMPVEVGGLRLYVEMSRIWPVAAVRSIVPSAKEVSFSAVPAGQSWGLSTLRFPIRGYRWRGAAYNGTWSALVPYGTLYYNQGEDYGAIPDRLEVLAVTDGVVTASPLPTARGTNLVAISNDDVTVRYSHINIETLSPHLTMGSLVRAGQVLGQTGSTWGGRRSQWADPHLHISFEREGRVISPYPFMVEAYLRAYDDRVLPVAGDYIFTTVGETVTLDATRTVARPGYGVTSYTWRTHDGYMMHGAKASVTYDAPGQYAVELTVETEDGAADRDFVHVRVYQPQSEPPKAFGWLYCWPLRGIRPGTPVLFWNRLVNIHGLVSIDYGDGWPSTPIENDAWYTYRAPGVYTVTLHGQSVTGDPVISMLRVVVE